MAASLSAPLPKRHNAGSPPTPTNAANSYRPGQAQQPFRTSSPSNLNPYTQRVSGLDSPSSETSSPQAPISLSSKYTSSPSLASSSPLLSTSPTMAGVPFDRISASDRDLKRYIDIEESQIDTDKRRADNRKTIQPHTFQKEQYRQQRYGSSGRQDAGGTRDRLASSPSQSYTSSSFADSSPDASFRTATSPNLGSPTSPQRSPAPVNYGHSAERLEMEPLLRSVGGDQEKALRKVLDERNSLAFQNAQLWKLIERERQKNADLRVARDGRRQLTPEDTQGSSPKSSRPAIAIPNQSNGGSQRPLTIREEEKENNDLKHVERQRANTVTDNMPAQTARPAPPARHYSDQQVMRPQGSVMPTTQSDAMTIEQNPFMLKLSNPLPFTSTHPSSPTRYFLPESEGSRPRFNSSPLIGTSSTPTSPRLPGFAGVADHLETPTAASGARGMTRASVSVSSLLPSPPIGGAPPLGDRTFSEQTESSIATPISEEMSTVPPPADTASFLGSRSVKGISASDRPDYFRTDSDATSVESPSAENTHAYHRGVPKLTTSLLQHTRCTIPSSRVMPNAAGKEVLCFIIRVMLRPPGSQQVLSWNVSKMLSAFASLDNRIRSLLGSKKEIKQAGIGYLPESKVWKDFAPSKIDQRKAMLELYLQSLLAAPMEKKEDLCLFLTTDVVAALPSEIVIAGDRPAKSGYLTKRGKNLGGWKTRYFTLEGSLLHYYDKRGGNHLGTIPILGAEIGRQHKDSSAGPQDDKAYRHALLIIELKRPGASAGLKHVLCAESDDERDAWVAVLLLASNKQTEPLASPSVSSAPDINAVPPLHRKSTSSSLANEVKKLDAEVQKQQGWQSALDVSTSGFQAIPPNPRTYSAENSFFSAPGNNELSRSLPTAMDEQIIRGIEDRSRQSGPAIKGSAPTQLAGVSPRKMKRQSAMPLRYQALTQEKEPLHAPLSKINSAASGRSGEAEAAGRITRDMISGPSNGTLLPAGFKFGKEPNERERKAKSIRLWGFGGKVSSASSSTLTQVFGVPLQQALLVKSIANLPTPVFRCIKYLEAHHAEKEEGIYRIGGSHSVMNRLKERFNTEGDVDLLANDEHWDIHAIAGLLKWYFRDLPISVLDEQQTAFVQTMGMHLANVLGWLLLTQSFAL
ncbi:hypothetical protein QFC19_008304 [Naganishia cerealis]|uniref:Uncharacterized protein n=1 Tax=Naganishia cerealis TaxID=610337 RepID=A0ACC2V383_9TREE|nr:hypothetical protein QFC19_008304 [Naganishia cerealis]